jgi:hypothetical protein
MLQLANIALLIFNGWILWVVATKNDTQTNSQTTIKQQEEAPKQQQEFDDANTPAEEKPPTCDMDGIIDIIADLKSEITLQIASIENKRHRTVSDALSVVCIAYQIHMRSGDHFWTYIDTNTGKPLFCTPNSHKTRIPTININPLPQEYREDLIEP